MQVLPSNTNNSIQHNSFVCTQLSGSWYCFVSQSFVYTVKWSKNSISYNSILHKSFVYTQIKCHFHFLSGVTTPGLSWPGSNDNKGIFHIPQISCSLTIRLFNIISRTSLGLGLTPLQKCSRCILLFLIKEHNIYIYIYIYIYDLNLWSVNIRDSCGFLKLREY